MHIATSDRGLIQSVIESFYPCKWLLTKVPSEAGLL